MVIKDWIAEAAAEIVAEDLHVGIGGRYTAAVESNTRDIIRRHSPFKDGVAYMPVPRCDQCRFWTPTARGGECQVIRHTSDESPRPRTARIAVSYEIGGHGGWLLMLPDFGCVQWEAK